MSRRQSAQPKHSQRIAPGDGEQRLERALAALAELDGRYEMAINELDESGAPQNVKERLAHVIKERHRLGRVVS
jgi:hypothetical protein